MGATTALVLTTIRGNVVLMIGYGVELPVLTWYALDEDLVVAYALLALCIIFVTIRLSKFVRQKYAVTRRENSPPH